MDHARTLVGPEVSWDCPSCGEHVTTRRIVGWDSLDAAWADAESALPEGWSLALDTVGGGRAAAIDDAAPLGPDRGIWGYGSTPAAALRELAARLRVR